MTNKKYSKKPAHSRKASLIGREKTREGVLVCEGLNGGEASVDNQCYLNGVQCTHIGFRNCHTFQNRVLPRWIAQGKYLLDNTQVYSASLRHSYRS